LNHSRHESRSAARHAQTALAGRLRVMPAVVVSGARQTGKSTLAQA
jgi:predicted AAA+ superfamily ATPase